MGKKCARRIFAVFMVLFLTVGILTFPSDAQEAAYTQLVQRREASLNGKKQFVGSRNLERPTVTYQWVDDAAMIDPPPGVQVIDDSGIKRNDYASCRYLKYMMPKRKPNRANNENLRARTRVVADLEWSVTYHRGMEKKRRRRRQEAKTSVQ